MVTDEQAVKLYQSVWGDTSCLDKEELRAVVDEVRQMISAPDLATAVDVVRGLYDAGTWEDLIRQVQELRYHAGCGYPDILENIELIDGWWPQLAAAEIRRLRLALEPFTEFSP